MDLNELLVFARVVQAGSFTAAARALRMPKSTVSRKVSELEERIGAQLLQRTTRQLRLTDVGQAYYAHCARVVAEAEEAELAVTRMQAAPHGLLRVTTPLTFSFLGPIVAEFLKRYPDVQVEMLCTDRSVALLEEGFDVAIRAGRLADSTLIARRLGDIERIVVASSGYIEEHGAPKTPKELEKHDCLVFGPNVGGAVWTLHSGTKTVEVPVRARMAVNEPDMLRALSRAGAGIALSPDVHYLEDVAAGLLRRILPEWSSTGTPVHAVYPGTRHHVPKVMAFVDFLRERWPVHTTGAAPRRA
ncbi:LysR family transcriptional regulator [Pyxidicoccus parkwayensis]|uniref:LysR family transcriptional regulator n=1 Tax=Pyxidicoccus parkwayensis TaxID=2813578 RepID=A0ABX7NJL2_9BACT|nr:LysR family transcriptional regulator [Pyxidicoccus parkwaysis]QSQ19047.1 LysR family transcriptional regulator [Pyxidicoccus parkwaysis]